MANLTITVDDEVLKRARIRALEQGTSVNALLSEHLARFARIHEVQAEAISGLVRLAEAASPADRRRARRRGGRRWTRDELHER